MSRRGRRARLAAVGLLLAAGAPAARAADGVLADARGDELRLAGDFTAAAAAYRQAIELNLGSATTHAKLGRVELERGRHRAAREALRRALELDPELAEARFELGVVYDELGFDRLARREYRRAFEVEPALTDPLRHPEVARRRQALSVLLTLWHEELGASGAGAGATAGVGTFHAAATRAPERPEPRSSSASTRSGARSGPGSAPVAKNDRVIDASDLRARSSVNQLQPSGEAASGRPRLPSATRGPGTRYTPPPPPPEEPEPEPEPEDLESLEEEESTSEEDEPPAEDEEPPASGF